VSERLPGKFLIPIGDHVKKASAEHRAKANGKPKADADAADKELDKVKKTVDDAKANALKITHDNSKSIEEIKAATEAVKKAEDDMKLAKKKHKDAVAPFKAEDSIAKAYHGYQRMFQ
jgi:esterase/lipase